jgi:hypothetical protein
MFADVERRINDWLLFFQKWLSYDAKKISIINLLLRHFRANLDDLKFDIRVSFPSLEIDCNYDVKIKIFGQSIGVRGDAMVKIDNPGARLVMKGLLYEDNGQQYLKFERLKLKLQPGVVTDLKLSNLFNNDPNFENAAKVFINTSSGFLMANVYPTIEKYLSEFMTEEANDIARIATFNELFPLWGGINFELMFKEIFNKI